MQVAGPHVVISHHRTAGLTRGYTSKTYEICCYLRFLACKMRHAHSYNHYLPRSENSANLQRLYLKPIKTFERWQNLQAFEDSNLCCIAALNVIKIHPHQLSCLQEHTHTQRERERERERERATDQITWPRLCQTMYTKLENPASPAPSGTMHTGRI